jgi:hypothetical protein
MTSEGDMLDDLAASESENESDIEVEDWQVSIYFYNRSMRGK